MKTAHILAALSLSVLPAAAAGEAAPAGPELWAGHQAVVGARGVPLVGDVKTRTDSYFLSEVERLADGSIRLVQRTCRVEIAEAAGVKVAFGEGAAPKLPTSVVELRHRDGIFTADFRSGWGEEDADGDGKPGATMHVKAPVCSGRLFVTSMSRTQLRGKADGQGLSGQVRAVSDQTTIDAEGACLKVMATDARDSVQGNFAYAPVPAGSTCESLLAAGSWPVRAAEPQVASEPRRRRSAR